MVGADALAVVRPTRVYLLDFFCSGIQFYALLRPYLCFISFLYMHLDLYVQGDDAWISWGYFMQTKHLCVLIHIWTKGEVGTVKQPSIEHFMRCFFCWSFLIVMLHVSVSCVVLWCRVCSLQPCGHLQGKDWSLGSRVCCVNFPNIRIKGEVGAVKLV